MAISGNKGEWSEIYTLFRLLGDGKLYAGDANLNKIMGLYYPIINIIRHEAKKYEYKPNAEQHVVVINEDGAEFARIPMNTFVDEADKLLSQIKAGKDRAFAIPEAEIFMNAIGCINLKAPSKDKADIHIIIHDLRTNMQPLLGFSIKSQLGRASTLLNAGSTTNITYKVTGESLSDEQISDINSIEKHLPRMEAIYKTGCKLEYKEIDNPTFKNNLLFIDCCLPQFIADCLVCDSLPNSTSTIKEAVEMIAKKNPFNFTGKNVLGFYEHKMKVLLLDSALGMTPAKEWNGKYDANGGYIVVKENGDIVCYHFYNRNEVEDYLYCNTRFERASRSRYKFGELFRDDEGEVCIKLNLQIRFIK